ncbi:MAG TPA: hypothetical protein VMF53_17515 [Alphaproteobacteria bacterium]|nr:hypothetical protein [Alphaproteobacteria bacterium]
MLGFSLPKLVVLIGIITFVWYGFKLVGRFQELREAEARRRARGPRQAAPPRDTAAAARAAEPMDVEDTVKCRVCGAYVTTRGATDCGQAGCPYGR